MGAKGESNCDPIRGRDFIPPVIMGAKGELGRRSASALYPLK
jgi:hypothetical protein